MGIHRPMSMIDEIFQPIHGKLCWQVKHIGSVLDLEFGEPHLEIQGPRKASKEASEKVRKNAARRHVFIRGEWSFHTWLCDWRIMSHGMECANQNSSRRIISGALRELEGQALARVSSKKDLGLKLKFDLGGMLEIIPNPKEDGTSSDLWVLFEPSDYCFAMRGDGYYCHMLGSTIPRDMIWRPLKALAEASLRIC
jgi:hypothetical protein